MSAAAPVLGHRKPAGDVRRERHGCRRLRSHRRLDVVAVQVEQDRPVARPAQLDFVAFADSQRIPVGGRPSVDETNLDHFLRGFRSCSGRGRRCSNEEDVQNDPCSHLTGAAPPGCCHRQARLRLCTCSRRCRPRTRGRLSCSCRRPRRCPARTHGRSRLAR